jgi:hypothetical protein
MTLRKESLRLYRDILRASRLFQYRNEKGELWSEILKKSARKEFEEARFEPDPLIISRLLVVGRDCLNQTIEKSMGVNKAIHDNIDKTRNRR